jgi:formate dehydrogenase iron-sulfur subunit
MNQTRRGFLKALGGGTLLLTGVDAKASEAGHGPTAHDDAWGCLVETSLCVGCRKCEAACNEANELPAPAVPFEDRTVCDTPRRPDAAAYTVVNRYETPTPSGKPLYNKFQCMHCVDPACVSACIVGALRKDPRGAVTYDADKCIGCRYCMVACPFQIPGYEYSEPLTPRVMKCNFCLERTVRSELPACAKICPEEAITFGKRTDLIEIAHSRIAAQPKAHRSRATLLDHVYGEHEVGGTSWMYLSRVPFTEIGLLDLPKEAPPRLTEKIQHGIFKFGFAPLALYGLLGAAMALFKNRKSDNEGGAE